MSNIIAKPHYSIENENEYRRQIKADLDLRPHLHSPNTYIGDQHGPFYDNGGAVINAKHNKYRAKGDGVTDDTAALQAWLDDLAAAGGRGYLPTGTYKHDGTLVLDTASEVEIEFAGDAWLAPTAGWGLKLDGCSHITLIGPKVRLNSGSTATRGIWVFLTTFCTIERMRMWSYINIPANCIGVDVDDNSYWCDVVGLRMRIDSGSLSGTFAAGVRVKNESNASSVTRSSINHCDDGVIVDGSNCVRVTHNSFENCDDGVEIVTPTASGNGSAIVAFNRIESGTWMLNISDSSVAVTEPSQYYGNQLILASPSTGINNPNGREVRLIVPTDLHMRTPGSKIVWSNTNNATSIAASITEASGSLVVGANGEVQVKGDLDASGNGAAVLMVGATTRVRADQTGISVFGVATVARQVSGANLTNNVTAGGTNNTIADFTDLTTYANDAAAIRNNIYQLARKLKQVNDALRLYGWLT